MVSLSPFPYHERRTELHLQVSSLSLPTVLLLESLQVEYLRKHGETFIGPPGLLAALVDSGNKRFGLR